MLKYKRKFGIFLFSALVLAIGFSPIASAHYNGDHIDFTSSGDYFILDLIGTPVEEDITVYKNSSGRLYQIRVTYDEGLDGSTLLTQEYVAPTGAVNYLLSSGKVWSVTTKLPYVGGVFTRSQFMDYIAKTNFVAISMTIDVELDTYGTGTGNGDIVVETTAPTNGVAFVIQQTVGSTVRYSWVYSVQDGADIDSDDVLNLIFDGTTPNVDGDVPFSIPFTNDDTISNGNSYTSVLSPFTITNNPAGAILPDADSTTIIVEGLDNLGDAIDTSIAAGVQEINSVVLQQTNEITGALESQTEAILNYRSDVDMSISQNAEVATKLAEESLINQQIYDGYVTPEYDKNVGNTIDQDFGDGVGFLSDAMQMIFDFGVGNLVLVLLTIGTSLFIIGRSMR